MGTIVIVFTYFIAIGIAVVTEQIDVAKTYHVLILAIVSISFLGYSVNLLTKYHSHLVRIPKEIKKLAEGIGKSLAGK